MILIPQAGTAYTEPAIARPKTRKTDATKTLFKIPMASLLHIVGKHMLNYILYTQAGQCDSSHATQLIAQPAVSNSAFPSETTDIS